MRSWSRRSFFAGLALALPALVLADPAEAGGRGCRNRCAPRSCCAPSPCWSSYGQRPFTLQDVYVGQCASIPFDNVSIFVPGSNTATVQFKVAGQLKATLTDNNPSFDPMTRTLTVSGMVTPASGRVYDIGIADLTLTVNHTSPP